LCEGDILNAKRGELLLLLPKELHPWRCSRPGWMGPWAA